MGAALLSSGLRILLFLRCGFPLAFFRFRGRVLPPGQSIFLPRKLQSHNRGYLWSVDLVPRRPRWISRSIHARSPLTVVASAFLSFRMAVAFRYWGKHLAQASYVSRSQDEVYSSNKSVSSLGRSSITSCPQAIVRVLQPFIFARS